jgi:hypothetical protein
MIERVARFASKAGYSLLAGVSTFLVLYPVHRAAAQDGPVSIPVPDMLVDFAQCLPLAILVAIIVEVVRLCIPWLSRKKGSNDAQKIVLRVLSPVTEPTLQLLREVWAAWRQEMWGLTGAMPRLWNL